MVDHYKFKDNALIQDRIATSIREMIKDKEFKPGDKLLSERKLAEKFNANIQTLRAAMKKLAEEGIIERRQGSGTYVTNGEQVEVQSNLVALLIKTEGHIFADLSKELCLHCQNRGWMPVVLSLEKDISTNYKSLNKLAAMGCTRLIAQGSDADSFLDQTGIDIKAYPRTVWLLTPDSAKEFGGNMVNSDWEHGVDLAVSHLAKLGHRHLAYLTHGAKQKNKPEFIQKIQPQLWHLEKTLQKYGISTEIEHVMDSIDDEETSQILKQFLNRKNRPSAIICSSDFRAGNLIDTAKKMGISIPEELSVIGTGDTPWAQAYGMTSLSFNLPEIAKEALILLDLPPTDNSYQVMVKPKLIIRKTTRALELPKH